MKISNLFSHRILFCLSLVCLTTYTSLAQTPDPGLMGSHTVLKQEYNLGDMTYAPPPAAMFPTNMEEIGSVHYPSDLSNGPYPVVVWLHGRHSTCYNTTTMADISSWPCPTGYAPIPSYEGYDYAAKVLASHGYIVISISANCINAKDGALSDAGMNARGVLVQHHLDLWKIWNTTGAPPFGTTFKNALDLQNVGTMGHSRGGEGVIYNAEYNKSLGSPYGIKAILTLAPVDFYRHFVNGIPVLDIAPYCDGDVSDLQGVHFYDDSRYPTSVTDETPKHTILMMGGNHNFFNTVWTPNPYIGGGADDWADYGYNDLDPACGSKAASRFDSTKQKNAYLAYSCAFYRLYLGHETQFAPILETRDINPPASSTLTKADVFVSYHPGKSDRKDINRVDVLTNLATNTLTGTVTPSGLVTSDICNGTSMPACSIGSSAQEPHKGGLGELRMTWDGPTDNIENAIPQANQDFSVYQDLIFRSCVNYAVTGSSTLDFTVQLTDSAGATASQQVSKYSSAMFKQKGTESGDLPKTMLNTICIPLDSFAAGVNLKKVRKVKFIYDKSATGGILVSDLAVANPVCGNFNGGYSDSIGHGYVVTFKNTASATTGDTLSYYWSFGDPTTGTRDTSTAPNPVHRYSAKGTYTACLYVKVKRANGLKMVCTDTFCTTITLVTSGVEQMADADIITIIPNPANDYLQIDGAAKTDVLKLMNLYGQVVFTTPVTESRVPLPRGLATGIYYAFVVTDHGTVYKKILISQ